ncbi:StlD/DarB family beta-ketosynthase [Prevotella nigrescens]|uniref:StlD/DarB family beta-ketosynthase n=1 Tax=Prevotella nigrescens TaxID=28133 RepID=UPI001C5E4ABA|nr:StlD/DarB family beta-ketosynthase [Prevotella nigrescens]MBW4726990.1 StlD/DarB family beta-ketosynthase [Prevotella nigrescens]
MEKAVYINSVSTYLPNSPIANEDMEDYIGKIGGNPSRVRSIVLRQNGIKTRYYGLDKKQNLTHSNAELAKEAVCGLFENGTIPDDLTLLACGTSTPDQLLPSHASMVHGELANFPMEIFSSAGVCLTSLQALKICYSNILAGLHQKAVCVASELTSPALVSKFYDPEYEATHDNPDKDPYMAFEKDFMRFMLSDGAGAVLVQDHPEGTCPLKIEWVDMTSYANELPTCMFMASELQENGRLKSWKEFSPDEIKERAVLVGKQDIRQLKKYIIKYWVDHIETVLAKHHVKAEEIDYVIPHVSSMFFYEKLNDEIAARNIALTKEKWFTNLTSVGNIGSAAIYVALEEFIRTKEIKRGNKILLLVPESGRFSYGTVLLSV